MTSKLPILYIAIANLLWSFIPVVVYNLFNEVSTLMVIFLRFFISGIVLLVIGLLLIYYNNNFTNNKRMSLGKVLKFTQYRNESFFNLKNIIYFAILGFFGIILQIIAFFMALKTTTIAFTMIGFQISIVIIAFYEHGIRSERLDLFKILYLLILVFSIGIIIFVKNQDPVQETSYITPEGLFFVLLFSVSLTFLHIGMSREEYDEKEIKLINVNKNYKIIRLLIKLAIIFLIGIILMIPFLLIVSLIPIQSVFNSEINKFFSEFPNLFQIMVRPEVLFLIILATIVPFLLLFLSRIKWTAYNLTYSNWSSVLTVIEPIGAIFFGVLIINEYFPVEFLMIVLFLLIISILFRYAHESRNKVNALVILNKKQGVLKNLAIELLKLDGVHCVDSVLGTFDLLLNVKTNSIKDFYYLINTQIRNIEGITEIKILFINKIHKINI
jgi:drug/metabolite transporter (DMT)-like permease